MKRAAGLLLLLLVGASSVGVSAQQQPAAPQPDICSFVAGSFSGPAAVLHDPNHRVLDGLTTDRGHFDIDGDGRAEDVSIEVQGLSKFANVIIAADASVSGSRRYVGRLTGAKVARFLPYGTRWYVVELSEDGLTPVDVYYYTTDEVRFACTFSHRETEIITDVISFGGPPDAEKALACTDFANASELVPAKDDTVSVTDLAALKASEPLGGVWWPNKGGCCTLGASSVIHADIDNDGKQDRLAWLHYESSAGKACEGYQFRLLPEKGATTIDADKYRTLLTRQNVDPRAISYPGDGCNTWRLNTVKNMTVLEQDNGVQGSVYSLRTPRGAMACKRALTTHVTVTSRESGRETGKDKD